MDAVDRLTIKRQFGRYNFVVEADIKGFFDNIEHDWLMRMLGERMEDGAFLRLIRKWLKAGVLDTDGQVCIQLLGHRKGVSSHPSLPLCTCTMRLTCGVTKWSSHDVGAKRA